MHREVNLNHKVSVRKTRDITGLRKLSELRDLCNVCGRDIFKLEMEIRQLRRASATIETGLKMPENP